MRPERRHGRLSPSKLGSSVRFSGRGARSQLRLDLSEERVAEAQLLLREGHFTGAAYLVGYAVEFVLKAIIANKQYGGFLPFPNILQDHKTHNLEVLLKHAGLLDKMRKESRNRMELLENWRTACDWGTHYRYTRLRPKHARAIIKSVLEGSDGVIPWLRRCA
jgi:HEPN domain-containing protein